MLLSLAVRITNAREMIRGFTRVRVRTPRERARESARARAFPKGLSNVGGISAIFIVAVCRATRTQAFRTSGALDGISVFLSCLTISAHARPFDRPIRKFDYRIACDKTLRPALIMSFRSIIAIDITGAHNRPQRR